MGIDDNKMDKFRETLTELGKVFREIKAQLVERGAELWKAMPTEDRLALMCYISHVLHAHAAEGGTYRYLIYDRLGFGTDAYALLQLCGLLDIHNLISGKLLASLED